jgi:hypothetical protein
LAPEFKISADDWKHKQVGLKKIANSYPHEIFICIVVCRYRLDTLCMYSHNLMLISCNSFSKLTNTKVIVFTYVPQYSETKFQCIFDRGGFYFKSKYQLMYVTMYVLRLNIKVQYAECQNVKSIENVPFFWPLLTAPPPTGVRCPLQVL